MLTQTDARHCVQCASAQKRHAAYAGSVIIHLQDSCARHNTTFAVGTPNKADYKGGIRDLGTYDYASHHDHRTAFAQRIALCTMYFENHRTARIVTGMMCPCTLAGSRTLAHVRMSACPACDGGLHISQCMDEGDLCALCVCVCVCACVCVAHS